jgi:hypothetical protein
MPDDSIILALAEQVACYRRLVKLAEIQHQYVQNSQTEQLILLLQSRQELIDQLTALARTIAPARQRWADFVGALDPAARREAETLMAETKMLLERITAADRDDVMALQQRKINLGRQIHQAANARQLTRNYAAAAYGRATPRMDLKR